VLKKKSTIIKLLKKNDVEKKELKFNEINIEKT